MLSIPAWFDWRPSRCRRCSDLSTLSIPAWFDWRAAMNGGATPFMATFNPSLVRLAPAPALGQGELAFVFQSQLGSIGATASAPGRSTGGSLSIPAWFDWRPHMGAPRHVVGTPFNPSLVRLALARNQRNQQHIAPFNPSLVRLALEETHNRLVVGVHFQSQLGSIGAGREAIRYVHKGSFQSQLGSIGATEVYEMPPTALYFQSQLGSIGARFSLEEPIMPSGLSIPAWFDWRMAPSFTAQASMPLSIPAWFDWRDLGGLPPL